MECHKCTVKRIYPKSKRLKDNSNKDIYTVKNRTQDDFTLQLTEQKQFGETHSFPDLWFEPQVVRGLLTLDAHRRIKQKEWKRGEQFAQVRLGNPI